MLVDERRLEIQLEGYRKRLRWRAFLGWAIIRAGFFGALNLVAIHDAATAACFWAAFTMIDVERLP